MKSHDKIWGDPTTKTSAYAGGIYSANKVFFYTEYFPRDGIMERVGIF